MSVIFAADLDNTLIHSYKIKQPGDICVEVKDGKKLSFMPIDSFNLLKEINNKCIFIPLTTRSLEQYRRIDLGIVPEYALTANGAILLVDGKIDENWLSQSHSMFNNDLPQISDNKFLYDIRYVDRFFVFAKSDNPQTAVSYLEKITDMEKFVVQAIYNKVYIFPSALNKGVALRRLKERVFADKVICAGDSVLDITMLELSDIAIAPTSLGINAITIDDFLFTRSVLQTVQKFL